MHKTKHLYNELERILKRDLYQYSRRRDTTVPYADDLDVNVLIYYYLGSLLAP
jgi:hypothetical protein